MEKFKQAVVSFIREAVKSNRWENENAPGSAHLKEIAEYEGVTVELQSTNESDIKEFFLDLTNNIEWALNDDWLPESVCALPLSEARCFLREIWPIIEEHGLQDSIQKIKEHHATYRQSL